MSEIELLELGAIALLFYFAIKEFFVFLKSKKPNRTNDVKKDIALINQQLNNHMNDYNKCINRIEDLVKENSNNIGYIKEAIISIESKLKK